MKVFLTSAAVAILVAYGASLVLDQTWQATSYNAFTQSSSVRLGDPGDNLVGADWPAVQAAESES